MWSQVGQRWTSNIARGSAATPLVEKENRELITESLSVLHKVVAAVEEDFPAVEDDDDSDGLWA